jgi:hypothetical protein
MGSDVTYLCAFILVCNAELRAGCNLPRHTGQAPPLKLTSTQTAIIKALLSKHKDNVEVSIVRIRTGYASCCVGYE